MNSVNVSPIGTQKQLEQPDLDAFCKNMGELGRRKCRNRTKCSPHTN